MADVRGDVLLVCTIFSFLLKGQIALMFEDLNINAK